VNIERSSKGREEETNMKKIVLSIFAAALAAGAANQQVFTGVITDSMCGKDHAAMKVAPDSKCVLECVKGGSKYALFVGNESYLLSDQKTPEQFAGRRVKVTGTLYEKTKILKVDSITAEGR
jgi:hypothetical protein